MAELNLPSRNRKATPKVDLTAMVDLAFLLITFFMLTTSLSKPSAMDVVKPAENNDNITLDLPASRTMTILLGSKNQYAWYMGEIHNNYLAVGDYNQLRKLLLKNKEKVAKANNYDAKKSLIVIVKPTEGANYKNFVDIMDELSIIKIATAPAIDDDHITDTERTFMKTNDIL